MRRVIPIRYKRAGYGWIAVNWRLSLFGVGPTRLAARRDLVTSARELRAELSLDANSLGSWALGCLKYLQGVALR